jgi:hypothetical protein
VPERKGMAFIGCEERSPAASRELEHHQGLDGPPCDQGLFDSRKKAPTASHERLENPGSAVF